MSAPRCDGIEGHLSAPSDEAGRLEPRRDVQELRPGGKGARVAHVVSGEMAQPEDVVPDEDQDRHPELALPLCGGRDPPQSPGRMSGP